VNKVTEAPQVILAFDFGARRIGVASGDTLTRTARGLKTLDASSGPPWPAIERLAEEYMPAQLVVGLPLNMDGTVTELTELCRRFARELHTRLGLPVALVDERLSSREAEAQLRELRASGLKRRKTRRADIDMTAARILLEQWLGGDVRVEESD
jgi:putative Holliday junction resolvase